MGYFDLKAICVGCGNEVGLNRFRLKQVENGWLCPKCMKKCFGINPRKVTLEEVRQILDREDEKDRKILSNIRQEIKEKIEQKEERRRERREYIKSNPIRTAEIMYENCLENNFGRGFNRSSALKHFSIIEKALMDNEEVKVTFIGLHNYISMTKHDGYFAYAITNKRFMIAQKKLIGEVFQTISLDNINDITLSTGILTGSITVDTIKEVFNVDVGKNSARNINTKIHKVLDSMKRISNSSDNQENSSNHISSADEIMKYKELLDTNIITTEEFEAKKKQLLGL